MKKLLTLLTLALTLFTLTSLLLVACADMGDPADTSADSTTTAVTTIDRDQLTRSTLSKQQQALYRSAWEAIKDTVSEEYTINDLHFGYTIMEYDEAFICYYLCCSKNGLFTETCEITSQTVAGYEFIYGSNIQATVFANGKKYNLETAYNAGVLTEDEIRMIWEEHKERTTVTIKNN